MKRAEIEQASSRAPVISGPRNAAMDCTNRASFDPDLIVEASLVCDISCSGCYAPNWTSKDIPTDSFNSRPDLFLSPDALRKALDGIQSRTHSPFSASIRGGEPTRHPRLALLVEALYSYASLVFLETHGRWIGRNLVVLSACRDFGAVVAISFDSMHGLSSAELQRLCMYLDRESVAWRIIITEESLERFGVMRSLCGWCSDEQITYQQKVDTAERLVRPRLSVVHVDGTVTDALASKDLIGIE